MKKIPKQKVKSLLKDSIQDAENQMVKSRSKSNIHIPLKSDQKINKSTGNLITNDQLQNQHQNITLTLLQKKKSQSISFLNKQHKQNLFPKIQQKGNFLEQPQKYSQTLNNSNQMIQQQGNSNLNQTFTMPGPIKLQVKRINNQHGANRQQNDRGRGERKAFQYSVIEDKDQYDYFETFTQIGSVNRKPKQYNQDSILFLEKCSQFFNMSMFGIMDGHGQYGHEVSNFMKRTIPLKFAKLIQNKYKQNIQQKISNVLFQSNLSQEHEILREVFTNTFLQTNEELIKRKQIDVNFSGSTCCIVLIWQKLIVCANVGDSRAI